MDLGQPEDHDDGSNSDDEKKKDSVYYQNILKWGEFEVAGWKPSGRYGHNAHIVGDNCYMTCGMERSNRVNTVSTMARRKRSICENCKLQISPIS